MEDDLKALFNEELLYNFSTEPKTCDFCAHYHGDYQVPRISCDAYPGGIPEKILDLLCHGNLHDKALAGDHGIFFKPKNI